MPADQIPIADAWENAVQSRMNRGMTRSKAIAAIARENPELHARYVQSANRDRPAAVRNSRFAG